MDDDKITAVKPLVKGIDVKPIDPGEIEIRKSQPLKKKSNLANNLEILSQENKNGDSVLSTLAKGFSDFASHIGEVQPNEAYNQQLNEMRLKNKQATLLSQQQLMETPAYKILNNMNNYQPQEIPEYSLPYNNTSAVSRGIRAKNGGKINYISLFK